MPHFYFVTILVKDNRVLKITYFFVLTGKG